MEWMACIKGNEFDLQELLKSLTSPELCIIKEEDRYYLKSMNFNRLKNEVEMSDEAERILSFINGALILGARERVTIANFISIKDDGEREIFFILSGAIPPPSRLTLEFLGNGIIQRKIHRIDPIPDWVADSIPDWIKIAQSDENVAKVLRLLSKGDYDWVNLYRIFEIIEEDVGGSSKIVQEASTTETAIGRFKHTANSVGAVGDDARHGKETTQPPKNPMTISEAKALIETILHNWLRSKK